MRVKTLIIGLIICATVFWGPVNTISFSDNSGEISNFYKNCVLKEIAKCESKIDLLKTTKSKNLQEDVEKEALKAKFLKAEMNLLIEKMIELKIEPRHHKVELFLNSQFHDRYDTY